MQTQTTLRNKSQNEDISSCVYALIQKQLMLELTIILMHILTDTYVGRLQMVDGLKIQRSGVCFLVLVRQTIYSMLPLSTHQAWTLYLYIT